MSDLPKSAAFSFQNYFESLDQRLGERRFALWTALAAFLLLQILVAPTYLIKLCAGRVDQSTPMDRWNHSYIPISFDPFYAATPKYKQCRLRILAPAIAWAIHLRGPWSALVAWIASIPCLFVGALLARRFLDPLYTVLFTLLLATLHPFPPNNVWLGYQDSLAMTLVLLSLVFRRWWQILPCLALAMLADERSISAGGLVFCWHWMLDPIRQRLRHGVTVAAAVVGALLVWVVYAAVMARVTGVSIDEIRSASANATADRYYFAIGSNMFATFRSAWLLPAVAAYLLVRNRSFVFAVALAAVTLPIFAISLTVGDNSRVMANSLPLIFISIAVIVRFAPQALALTIPAALALNLISPVTTGIGPGQLTYHSTPAAAVFAVLKYFKALDDRVVFGPPPTTSPADVVP